MGEREDVLGVLPSVGAVFEQVTEESMREIIRGGDGVMKIDIIIEDMERMQQAMNEEN